jgi:hypothetical protein
VEAVEAAGLDHCDSAELGHLSLSWVAEGGEIPLDDPDLFGRVDLLPSGMQSLKSIVPITNESLRQSSLALDSVIQARLGLRRGNQGGRQGLEQPRERHHPGAARQRYTTAA